jgi:hypothetical protein
LSDFRKDTVDNWNLAIDDALEFRRKYGREGMWAECEAMFYNAHHTQLDQLGPNLIYSTGDSLLSSLCVPNPYFTVRPNRMEVIQGCPILESQLNAFIWALDLKGVGTTSALNGYLFGKGIAKIGYDSEFGYDPRTDIGFQLNNILGLSLSQFDKRGRKIEYNSQIVPGMPWVESVLPHDFLVPWGTTDLTSAPWCAHRIIRHIDDIKADRKYSNKKDLVPMLSMADWVKSYLTVMKPYRVGQAAEWTKSESSDKAEFVELWEIHDARTGRVRVLSPGYDKFLRDDIDYLQEDGLPFVDLSFVTGNRSFWTTADAVYLQSTQAEAINIASVMRKQRNISLLRFLLRKGTMSKDEVAKYLSGDIGILAEYDGAQIGEASPITAVSHPNNNQVLQQEAEYMRRDARETVGFSRNQLGEYEASGRRTATEAGIVQQSSDQRLNRRQDQMAEFYQNIGKKLAKTIFKFWKTPRLVQIVGQDGAASWTSFTGSQLKGDYLYKVGFSSEPSDSHQRRKTEALTLYSQLSQDPSIDQLALRRHLVRAFNDPEFTSLFLPGVISNAALPNAMQQMQQQMGQPGGQMQGGGGAKREGGVSPVQKPGDSSSVSPKSQQRGGMGQ